MKKFTQAIVAVHEAESAGKSELQKSYQDYFAAKLNKYGVKSPAELDADKKSQFFSEISKDWERGQGATEAGKADVEKHGVKESEEINEGTKFTEVDLNGSSMTSRNGVPGQGDTWEVIKKLPGDKWLCKNLTTPFKDPKYTQKEWTTAQIKASGMKPEDANKPIHESLLNEADVKSDADFKEYAQNILKKAHKDDYDEKKADATINGILKKADGDYGKAVGILNNSLG